MNIQKKTNEVWSKAERRKRSKKCANPRGFTMKQFCKNIRSRSKPGQKTNEVIEAVFRRLLREELQVKTAIKPSDISGMGLFACEDIPVGTTIFSWDDQVDQEYSEKYMNRLPPEIKKDFTDLASTDGVSWFLAGDGGSYFNHSDDPNVGLSNEDGPPAKRSRKALRDITAGEELTMDYAEIGIDVPRRTFET